MIFAARITAMRYVSRTVMLIFRCVHAYLYTFVAPTERFDLEIHSLIYVRFTNIEAALQIMYAQNRLFQEH
jgi:hypothetical protein